jgi:hypothetical protein
MLVALKCQEDSGKAIGSGKVGNESDLRHSALDPELLELAQSRRPVLLTALHAEEAVGGLGWVGNGLSPRTAPMKATNNTRRTGLAPPTTFLTSAQQQSQVPMQHSGKALSNRLPPSRTG